MKKLSKLGIFLLSIFLCITLLACGEESDDAIVDYVSQVELTESFAGKTFLVDGIEEVQLYAAVDGDTIHVTNKDGNVLKLRFLGVDTPESTGQIEPWGKTASLFTKERVTNTTSLVIQTDGGPAVFDSTGGRYMSWIWYKNDAGVYRLLNLELVQEGLSFDKSSGCKNYKEELHLAAVQAQRLKIGLRSSEKDPNYYYGSANELTLKELRLNVTEYLEKKVAFEGVITRTAGLEAYIEEYDVETEQSYGMQIFIGYQNIEMIAPGNRLRVCGKVTYYDTAGVYQISDVKYIPLSTSQDNMQLISEGNELIPTEMTVDKLQDVNDTLPLFTFVEIKNLQVNDTYTTVAEDSSSKGAISVYCTVDGKEIVVRTIVMYDKTGTYIVGSNNLVLESNFTGKNIDVKGVLTVFDGKYQLKLFSMSDVTFK